MTAKDKIYGASAVILGGLLGFYLMEFAKGMGIWLLGGTFNPIQIFGSLAVIVVAFVIILVIGFRILSKEGEGHK